MVEIVSEVVVEEVAEEEAEEEEKEVLVVVVVTKDLYQKVETVGGGRVSSQNTYLEAYLHNFR